MMCLCRQPELRLIRESQWKEQENSRWATAGCRDVACDSNLRQKHATQPFHPNQFFQSWTWIDDSPGYPLVLPVEGDSRLSVNMLSWTDCMCSARNVPTCRTCRSDTLWCSMLAQRAHSRCPCFPPYVKSTRPWASSEQ